MKRIDLIFLEIPVRRLSVNNQEIVRRTVKQRTQFLKSAQPILLISNQFAEAQINKIILEK